MLGADPLLIEFVLVMLSALVVLFVFYWLKQPSVVAYIAAGVMVGPFGLSLISDAHFIEILGEFGVVLLLFFIGMEVSIDSLIKNWRVVILGTLMQIAGSVFFIGTLGFLFDWGLERSILLGFVISLSSTAVILRFLESRGMIQTQIGKDVIGVLVAQDLLIIPMLITITAISGEFSLSNMLLQVAGMVVLLGLFVFSRIKKIKIPTFDTLASDSDYKLFLSFVLCFGVALLSALFHLSVGMGAFIGGMIAANIENIHWIRDQLHSFKTLFIALFFMSVGLLINIPFVWENIIPISIMVAVVFLVNTFINALIFRWLRLSWKYSLYAGAILAQIGEFSFFLASVGFQLGTISTTGYQIAIAVIALSLLFSPLWIKLFERFEGRALLVGGSMT